MVPEASSPNGEFWLASPRPALDQPWAREPQLLASYHGPSLLPTDASLAAIEHQQQQQMEAGRQEQRAQGGQGGNGSPFALFAAQQQGGGRPTQGLPGAEQQQEGSARGRQEGQPRAPSDAVAIEVIGSHGPQAATVAAAQVGASAWPVPVPRCIARMHEAPRVAGSSHPAFLPTSATPARPT